VTGSQGQTPRTSSQAANEAREDGEEKRYVRGRKLGAHGVAHHDSFCRSAKNLAIWRTHVTPAVPRALENLRDRENEMLDTDSARERSECGGERREWPWTMPTFCSCEVPWMRQTAVLPNNIVSVLIYRLKPIFPISKEGLLL
jgi:hypothetical protein